MVEETGAILINQMSMSMSNGPFASFEFEFSLAPKHSSYVMFLNYLVFAKNSLPAHK